MQRCIVLFKSRMKATEDESEEAEQALQSCVALMVVVECPCQQRRAPPEDDDDDDDDGPELDSHSQRKHLRTIESLDAGRR